MVSAIRDFVNEEINMNISSAAGVKTELTHVPQPTTEPSRTEVTKRPIPITPEIPTSKVSISGHALMIQRVFDGAEPRHRPISVAGTSASLFMNPADFLTRQDCQLLGDVYAFAQESGADLRFVDDLGFSLAGYRSLENGKRMGPHNDGTAFDTEGHMLSFSFLEKDVAITRRILASDTLKTTQLDQGFIRYKTDVRYSATDANYFEFLEQVINKFSARGDDVPLLDDRFSRYESREKAYNMHVSAETYEFGPKGPFRKGTAAANTTDPNAVLGKRKKNSPNIKPETVQDMFRRIMAKAWGTGFGLQVRSLAEFLMRSGR
jgi:hypothetical protein